MARRRRATLLLYTLLGPLFQRRRELAAARVNINPAAHARRRADAELVLECPAERVYI